MDHLRHSGIFNAGETAVTLIGAGGIGALTAVTLAKMGVPYLAIFDDDTVDDVNLPTQFHAVDALGDLKTNAVGELVRQFSDETSYNLYPQRVDANTPDYDLLNPIIISAVDSIKARKAIWEAVKKTQGWKWYLDARMGAEIFSLYSVNHNDRGWYEVALSMADDAKIPEDPCTSKATIYTACISAGHLGNAVRKIVTGEPLPHLLQHNIKEMHIVTL